MMSDRRTALIAGLLYLLTFAASIPAVLLLGPVLNDPAFITGVGSAPLVRLGAVLDLVNAAACIGTAVVLYPVLRRTAPVGALGFVTSRLIEAAIISVGVIAVLTVVGLRPAPDSLLPVASALVALRDWTFLLGPGLMPAINAALLATALWRARLVPRAIPMLGLIGAPLQLISVLASVFAVNSQVSPLSAVAVIPIFFWELLLGLWLTIRGFRTPSHPQEAA
jgi:hypothetical protein